MKIDLHTTYEELFERFGTAIPKSKPIDMDRHHSRNSRTPFKKYVWWSAKGKLTGKARVPASTDQILMHYPHPAANLVERFFANALPTTPPAVPLGTELGAGAYGGSGGTAGGSPMDARAKRIVMNPCERCKNPWMHKLSNEASSCPECGNFEGKTTPASVVARRGGAGIYNTDQVGVLRTPNPRMVAPNAPSGGSFSSNENASRSETRAAADEMRMKYMGADRFSLDFGGVKTEHSIHCAHAAMKHRIPALGFNHNRLMCELIDWLYLKAHPGQEYLWNFNNGTRMVLDGKGFKYHVDNSGQG